MVHLVAYELRGYRPSRDYHAVAEEIKNISGVWCHFAESKFLIETDESAKAVSDRIAPFTHVGDPLFVTRIYNDWAAWSLTDEQINWLHQRDFSSPAERFPTGLLAGLLGAQFSNPIRPASIYGTMLRELGNGLR